MRMVGKINVNAGNIPINKTTFIKKRKFNNFKNDKSKYKNDKSKYKSNIQMTKGTTLDIKPKVENRSIPDNENPFHSLWVKYKPKSSPHVTTESDWIRQLLPEKEGNKPLPLAIRRQLKELTKQLYEDDLQAIKILQEKHNHHGNKHFHKAILTHGTTKDKIAAYTLRCMELPVYSLNDLFHLIDCVDSKFKNNLQDAIDNVKKLFQTTLLAHGHKAREFESHDFSILIPLMKNSSEQVEKQLVLWYFESQIQIAYLKFIDNLEKVCHITQLKIKTKGVKGLLSIVRCMPKQEPEIILQKLVNKFGDTNKAIAGYVLWSLISLQVTCPQFKVTIVSLIEELLYRPNVSAKSQYYGLCFLKDVIFLEKDGGLAEKVVKMYFDFFQKCSKSGDVNSRFMGALLRGLNRAYPYLEGKRLPFLEDQITMIYKLCHLVGFNLATQALQLIYQVQNSVESETSDRFYSLIYSKLLDPSFGNSSASGSFLNIIFKSLAKDQNVARICAFVRRLLQVCKYLTPPVACGTLFLVSEAIRDNPNLSNIRALLMSEDRKPNKLSIKLEENEENDYEYYPDLDTDDEDKKNVELLPTDADTNDNNSTPNCHAEPKLNESLSPVAMNKVKIKSESSWLHRDNLPQPKNRKDIRTLVYDPTIRNPLFSGANLSPMWELQNLKQHYHPTVALFASNLLNEIHTKYSGDPLQDFTLTRFLDRFTHRNPKKIHGKQNKALVILGSQKQYTPVGSRNIPVESDTFKNLKKEKIATEDLFFYNYFTQYRKQKEVLQQKRTDDDDDDSVGDEEFADYLQRMNNIKDEDDEAYDDEEVDFAANATAVSDDEAKSDDEDGSEKEDLDLENAEMEDDEMGDDAGSELGEGLSDEDDDEGAFDEDEDDEEMEEEYDVPKRKAEKGKWKPSSGGWRGMLVDADEFSHLLEDEAEMDDNFAGTSEAVSNKDKAHRKQLLWEQDRRGSIKSGKKLPFKAKGPGKKPLGKPNFKAKLKGGKGKGKGKGRKKL